VWSDFRNSHLEIYGARVDQAGNVLDPGGGYAINTATTGQQTGPSVSGMGNDYLVSWFEDRTNARVVRGSIIAGGSTVLHNPALTLSSDTTKVAGSSAIGTFGPQWFVAFDQFPLNGFIDDIAATRVGPGGQVMDLPNLVVTNPAPPDGDYLAPTFAMGGPDSLLLAYTFPGGGRPPNQQGFVWGSFFFGACTYVGVPPTHVAGLTRAWPNPFTSQLRVEYTLSANGWQALRLYDVRGRVVATLDEGNRAAGIRTVRWTGPDSGHLGAGVYFVVLETPHDKQILTQLVKVAGP
jgi:hypothetical protein